MIEIYEIMNVYNEFFCNVYEFDHFLLPISKNDY